LIAVLAAFAVAPLVTGTCLASEKVLYSFNNNGTDGREPFAGLVFGAAGNLYGTTLSGGAYNYGVVFELTPKAGGGWTEKVLYSFNDDGKDGYSPHAGLVFDAAGNLYGATLLGGAGLCTNYAGEIIGCGTVFELTRHAGGVWTEAVLYSFSNSSDGGDPQPGLIIDTAGNLYGTTSGGGTYSEGTVFELTPAAGGGWSEKVLHAFSNNGTDGEAPNGGLIFDPFGNLYGTTVYGGAYNNGTVFELNAQAGGVWTETVLHAFSTKHGDDPQAGLAFDAAGNLYGTTTQGISSCQGVCGVVFKLTPQAGGKWIETILHNFTFLNGYDPVGSLIFDPAGNLYGATSWGGAHNVGTVFELTPQAGGGWTEKCCTASITPMGTGSVHSPA
jgi:uncharacterized repeat protein (TIGR03803 family)